MNFKREFNWKFFFFNAGFICLLTWNSIISINDYSVFQTKINNILNYITIGYSLGGILSFLTNSIILKKISFKKKLYLSATINFLVFILWFIIIQFSIKKSILKLLGFIIFFFGGFFSICYQSIIIGLASSINYKEVSYFNNGNTMTAIITNSIVFIIYLINPEIRKSFNFCLIYLIILIIYISIFYFNFFIFFKKNKLFIFKKLNKKINDLKQIGEESFEKKINLKSMIINNLDLIFGIFFVYTTTLSIFPNFYYHFHISSNLGLPIVFLSYAVFDLLGRLIPEKFILKESIKIHLLNILRIIIFIISIIFSKYSILVNENRKIEQILFYILLFGLLSITNGYLTMCFFSCLNKRYKNEENKNYAGKLVLFGLYIGIFYGTLLTLVS